MRHAGRRQDSVDEGKQGGVERYLGWGYASR